MTALGAPGAALIDNQRMHRLRNSRWTHWVGIVLVLLPLLAPTISHALRHAGVVRVSPDMAGVVCVPSLASTTTALADGVAADARLSHVDAIDASLHACGYCACPAFGHPMPVTASDASSIEPRSSRIATVTQAERPGSCIERPRARSPPHAA